MSGLSEAQGIPFAAATPRAPAPAPRRPSLSWSMRVGRLFGVDLYVHGTLLLLLAWIGVAYILGGGGVARALYGATLIFSIMATVVLHELGHALVARRFGVGTRDITLLPIGGIASLDRMPERPRHELAVALAGPAVNVAIAAILALVLLLAGRPIAFSFSIAEGGLLQQILAINLSLAAFNLLPAFPMDGGRALRAALSSRFGPVRATEMAARAGQLLAIVFAAIGIFANLFLVAIAFFVWMGAAAELAATRTKALLESVPVRSATIARFVSLSPQDPLARAVDALMEGFQQAFPVVHEGRVVGVLTLGDVVGAIEARGTSGPVGVAMTGRSIEVRPEEPLEPALRRLREADAALLVVVDDDGAVLGIVTPDNVAELLAMRGAFQRFQQRPA